jgi:hypothetical protein
VEAGLHQRCVDNNSRVKKGGCAPRLKAQNQKTLLGVRPNIGSAGKVNGLFDERIARCPEFQLAEERFMDASLRSNFSDGMCYRAKKRVLSEELLRGAEQAGHSFQGGTETDASWG